MDSQSPAVVLTIPGRRPYNQDSVVAEVIVTSGGDINVLILADGMGGALAGEEASRIAARTTLSVLRKQLTGNTPEPTECRIALQTAFEEAQSEIRKSAVADPEHKGGMGTTLVCLLVHNSWALAANVGDSRAYWIEDQSIQQLTVDHTHVQDALARGAITTDSPEYEMYEHALTRSLDETECPTVDIFPLEGGCIEGTENGVFLLCSDGLNNGVDDEMIRKVVARTEDMGEASRLVVQSAYHGGSKDNISVILLEQGSLPREDVPLGDIPDLPEDAKRDLVEEQRAKHRRRAKQLLVAAIFLILLFLLLLMITLNIYFDEKTQSILRSDQNATTGEKHYGAGSEPGSKQGTGVIDAIEDITHLDQKEKDDR